MNKKLPPPKFKGYKCCRNCGYCEIISVRYGGKTQAICKITEELKTVHNICNVYK